MENMKTQTNSQKYEGQCKFCGSDFSKKEILSHLDSCQQRTKSKSSNLRNLRLQITDRYSKNFWLIVEVDNSAKFKDLDKLIRDVWVECCGHLSLFGDYGNEIKKSKIIMETLQPGDTVPYIYDFGSSTELIIKAIAYSSFKLIEKKIELVARNYLPPSNCAKCGQQATWICTTCSDEEDESPLVCDDCAEKYHSEEEDHYLLQLANSPRSGVCGYEPEEPLDKLF